MENAHQHQLSSASEVEELQRINKASGITSRMKQVPDAQNEVQASFKESTDHLVVTCVMQGSPKTMSELVARTKQIVQLAHQDPRFIQPDADGVTRAQMFEEGFVFMLEKPFAGYPASKYLMDFFDVNEQGICSRMHLHTGKRSVRIMTAGPGAGASAPEGDALSPGAGISSSGEGVPSPKTTVRISSLVPIEINGTSGFSLPQEVDEMPDMPGRKRYSVIVPPNSIVDVQIPAGVSHQFNADGRCAVIDSVHIEEDLEIRREDMKEYNMRAQTIFLTENHPPSKTCLSNPKESHLSELETLYATIAADIVTLVSPGRPISPAPHLRADGTVKEEEKNTIRLRVDPTTMPASQLKACAGRVLQVQAGVEGVGCVGNLLTLTTTEDPAGEALQHNAHTWMERVEASRLESARSKAG